MALLNSESDRCIPVVAVFDNEEVGSGHKTGLGSTFLYDILRRINRSLGRTEEEYLTSLASSFMVSADNGHAVHPNYADKTDPTNRTYLNGGLVIKHSANQKYTTDACFRSCYALPLRAQVFRTRNFKPFRYPSAAPLSGNISNAQVSLNTVDVGLPQLAMHSPYGTAGSKGYGLPGKHLRSSSNPRSVLRATVRLYLSNSDSKIRRNIRVSGGSFILPAQMNVQNVSFAFYHLEKQFFRISPGNCLRF